LYLRSSIACLCSGCAAGSHPASDIYAHTGNLFDADTSVTLKFTGTEDISLQTSFVIDDTAVTTG